MKDIYNILWNPLRTDVQNILDKDFEPTYDEMKLIKENCSLNTSSTIIDLGCGTGKQSNALYNEYKCNVIAIDLNVEFITEVNDNVIKKSGTFEDLPIEDNSVDLIFIRESLLHAKDLKQSFKEFDRVLKEDGQIYLFGAFISEKLSNSEFKEIESPLQLKKVNMDFSNLKVVIQSYGFRIKINENRLLISSQRSQKEFLRICNLYLNRNELLKFHTEEELDLLEATYKYHIWGNLGKIELKEMIIDRT